MLLGLAPGWKRFVMIGQLLQRLKLVGEGRFIKPSFASLRKKSLVENTLVFSYKDQLFRIACRNNCYCSDSNVKHTHVNTLCG